MERTWQHRLNSWYWPRIPQPRRAEEEAEYRFPQKMKGMYGQGSEASSHKDY